MDQRTIPEAAAALGVSDNMLYARIADGSIPPGCVHQRGHAMWLDWPLPPGTRLLWRRSPMNPHAPVTVPAPTIPELMAGCPLPDESPAPDPPTQEGRALEFLRQIAQATRGAADALEQEPTAADIHDLWQQMARALERIDVHLERHLQQMEAQGAVLVAIRDSLQAPASVTPRASASLTPVDPVPPSPATAPPSWLTDWLEAGQPPND